MVITMSDERGFKDPERDLHVEEFKVRLRPVDAALIRALARKRDVPPAVFIRALVLREIGPADYRLSDATANRRPA